MKGKQKMNDLEFILTDAGINYNNISNEAKIFIKEKLIPHYEFSNNQIFGSTIFITHSKTQESRKLNAGNIVSMLKKLL